MKGASLEAARAAKEVIAALMAGRPEFKGAGIAVLDDGYGVKLNLSRCPPDLVVPNDVDGVPVIIDIVGTTRRL